MTTELTKQIMAEAIVSELYATDWEAPLTDKMLKQARKIARTPIENISNLYEKAVAARTSRNHAPIAGVAEVVKPREDDLTVKGYVWYRDQWKGFFKMTLIRRGKNKGRYKVLVGNNVTGHEIVVVKDDSELKQLTEGETMENIKKAAETEADFATATINRTPAHRKAKAMKTAKVKAAKEKKADPKAHLIGTTVTQMDYHGKPETLDAYVYCNKVKCENCGEIRWVKNADVFQVKLCKPCKAKKVNKKKADSVKSVAREDATKKQAAKAAPVKKQAKKTLKPVKKQARKTSAKK